MKDDKTPLEEPNAEESQNVEEESNTEEYSFMQEVIKDEKDDPKRWKNDILRMTLMGFVFGIVACFSFFAFKPAFEKRFSENPGEVTIPPEQDEETTEEESKEEPKVVLDADSYKQMLQSLQAVARGTKNCVATISGLTGEEDWTKESDTKKKSISGVIIADNGQELLILGRTLPMKDAKIIRVTLNDDNHYEAAIKSQNELLNLCIYAIQRKDIAADSWSRISTAKLGSSKYLADGDTVIILGKPFGYGDAVSYGIVASNENQLETSDGHYQIINTDISGSAAGSGIIINIHGEMIGIIDMTALDEENQSQVSGYGISDIKNVIELMSNGKKVPYLGINGIDITEDMINQGLPQGVYVREVDVDSPAMTAGIQSGDIITRIEEEETVSLMAYHNILMRQNEGTKVILHGKRQGTGGEYVDIEFAVTVGSK